MKKTLLMGLFGIFLLAPFQAEGQILKKISKKVSDKVDQKIDEEIDKGLEGSDDEAGGTEKDPGSENAEEGRDARPEAKGTGEKAARPWSKFDFVPGETVLFEDNLEGEKNGEFPSQWDLIDGYVENALFAGENVIRFPIENTGATIKPLIKKEGDYLPDKFTIEFDMYLSSRTSKYTISLWDVGESSRRPEGLYPIEVGYEQGASYELSKMQRNLPAESEKEYPHWRHVAISFNVRALKIYMDQDRLLMIPNVQGNPTAVSIKASTYDSRQTGDFPTLIKNIRIAEGAVELYDRFMTDGKIVANGIKFDSGKATLKPESMGVINEIVKLMKEHPEIRFSVEGHTDSDGDAAMNKTLSEARAQTVKTTLVDLGITPERLVVKGYGEEVPVADNSSPEGKANNRRVEFVKM
ncbi:MAG TPA: OmpA family protein [Robiginitalea sp.]|nr:OmpA family protein [Robiginitalea sp.]